MRLIELTLEHYQQFVEMAKEYSDSGDDRYMDHITTDSYQKYLMELENFKNEETAPAHLVPCLSFWLADENNELLGSIRYRTKLNKDLLIEGGHIGYDIRPSRRNQGLATDMLSLLLKQISDIAEEKVLITCHTDNPASEKVILKHGGELESIEPSPRNGKMTKRYWVDVPHP